METSHAAHFRDAVTLDFSMIILFFLVLQDARKACSDSTLSQVRLEDIEYHEKKGGDIKGLVFHKTKHLGEPTS